MKNGVKKDPFGFRNQAKLYSKFRPKYPVKLVKDGIINNIGNNAIDLACGTGILTEMIHDLKIFKRIYGLDQSSEQLKYTKDNDEIKYVQGDVFEIHQIDEKFDLITIGQGLHWFEFDEFMTYVSNLSSNFVAFGYGIPIPIDREIELIFNDYYLNVLKSHDKENSLWDCDRIALDTAHKNQNFKQYYKNVERIWHPIEESLTLEAYFNYLKTQSVYHKILELGYNDPLPDLENNIKQKMKGEDDIVKLSIPFWCISCTNL
jgi:trans-aconitate methyltransferase